MSRSITFENLQLSAQVLKLSFRYIIFLRSSNFFNKWKTPGQIKSHQEIPKVGLDLLAKGQIGMRSSLYRIKFKRGTSIFDSALLSKKSMNRSPRTTSEKGRSTRPSNGAYNNWKRLSYCIQNWVLSGA